MKPRKRFAATVKVGEKGQFVVPKEIREMFDIQPGDTLLLLADTLSVCRLDTLCLLHNHV